MQRIRISIILLSVLSFTICVRASTNEDSSARPPQIKASVYWQFSEGFSSRWTSAPDRWITTITINSEDDGRWTAVPDMVTGEVVSFVQTRGICAKDTYYKRNRCVSFGLQQAPADANGGGETYHKWVAGSIRIGTVKFGADWKLNGKGSLWQPTQLKKGDILESRWSALLSWSLTKEAREDPNHYVFCIGPILYEQDKPEGIAYVVLARSDSRQGDIWFCERPQLFPLTSNAMLREIKDENKPFDWRCQLLTLLWDQPRPCPDTDKVLLGILQDTETYSATLRMYTAYNLIERRYAQCKPVLFSIAANKKADAGLRSGIIGRFSSWPGSEAITAVSTIAKDPTDDKDVREAAVTTLAEFGDEGRSVLETLTDDEVVGKKALNLLKSFNKKDEEGSSK